MLNFTGADFETTRVRNVLLCAITFRIDGFDLGDLGDEIRSPQTIVSGAIFNNIPERYKAAARVYADKYENQGELYMYVVQCATFRLNDDFAKKQAIHDARMKAVAEAIPAIVGSSGNLQQMIDDLPQQYRAAILG